jgi:hypothetical protein
MAVFCQADLERLRHEIETPAWHRRELSAFWVAAMPRMSFSWWYTLSTPSVEGVGNMSKSAAVAATFWMALTKAGCCLP